MYTFGSTDTAPVLQYSVEVTKRDPPTGWLTVPAFVSGPPRRPLSKEAFYSKLGQTPDAALPKVQQTVTITFRQEAQRTNGARAGGVDGGGVVQALTGDDGSDAESDIVDVGSAGGDDLGGLVPAAGAADTAGREEAVGKGAALIVDVFLVCAAIGGGEAKKMACLPQHRHMKLIPWGGVRPGGM